MRLRLRYILVSSIYVWKHCYSYVPILFVFVTYFLLRGNDLIYLFDAITFFGNVRMTLYFDKFELRMEITL